MKIEDGIIDPPRRTRLHSSSFCLFPRVTRGGGGGGGGGGQFMSRVGSPAL